MENGKCDNGGGCSVGNQQGDMAVSREPNQTDNEAEGSGDEVTLDAICYEFTESLFELLGAARPVRSGDCPALHKSKQRFANSVADILLLLLPEEPTVAQKKMFYLVTYQTHEMGEDDVIKISSPLTYIAAGETPEEAESVVRSHYRESMTFKVEILNIEEATENQDETDND